MQLKLSSIAVMAVVLLLHHICTCVLYAHITYYVRRPHWGPEYARALQRHSSWNRGKHGRRRHAVQVFPASSQYSPGANSTFDQTCICGHEGDGASDEESAQTCPWSSSLTILQHLDLSELFEAHVAKALCSDSYKFLKDHHAYAAAEYPTPADQVSL